MNHQGTKAPRTAISSETDAIAKQVVDAAYAVHRALGPGLLESVYEICLVHELVKRGLNVERQVSLPVVYDSLRLDAGLRLDLSWSDKSWWNSRRSRFSCQYTKRSF